MKRTRKKVAHKRPAKKKEKPTVEEQPVEEKLAEKKVGFWARLFGRKEKPAEEKEAR